MIRCFPSKLQSRMMIYLFIITADLDLDIYMFVLLETDQIIINWYLILLSITYCNQHSLHFATGCDLWK
jgi:hypothetical protein